MNLKPFGPCPFCLIFFSSKDQFKRHCQAHSDEEKAKIFDENGDFFKNLKKVKPYRIKCSRCGRRFKKSYSKQNHLKTCGQERAFPCQICPHKCFTERDLEKHVNYMHNEAKRVGQCHICNQTFKSQKSYEAHMRLHPSNNAQGTDDANFKCDKCDLAFETKDELDDHEGLHQLSQDNAETLALMSDRKWKCEFCTRSFKGKQIWMYHRKLLHADQLGPEDEGANLNESTESNGNTTAESEMELDAINTQDCTYCPYCRKKLSRKSFKRHMVVQHSKNPDELLADDPFDKSETETKCILCDTSFDGESRVTDMRQHIRDFHGDQESFSCEYCQKEFVNIRGLEKHLKLNRCQPKNKLEKPFKCDYCDVKFSNYHSITVHLKKNRCRNYQIEENGEVKISTNKIPISVPTRRLDIPCKVCHEVFEDRQTLRKHVFENHKEIQMFQCDICEMAFPRRETLSMHMKFKHKVMGFAKSYEKEKVYKCPVCERDYIAFKTLKLHISHKHPYEMDAILEKLNQMQAEDFIELSPEVKNEVIDDDSKSNEKPQPQLLSYVDYFPCEQCQDLNFQTISELDEHVPKNHPESEKCEFCGKWFDNFVSMRSHKGKIHQRYIRFQCSKCGETFRSEKEALKHVDQHEHVGEKLEQIKQLNEKMFETDEMSDRKSEKACIERIYVEALKFSECLKCNKSYSCWVDIRYHCQTAHPEESEQLLEQIKQLNDEMFQTEEISVEKSAEKLDESENGLVSDQEPSSEKLDQPNIKKETPEIKDELNQCEFCGETQANAEDHISHLKSDHKMKEVCEECFKTFQTPQSLKRHRVVIHNFVQRYKCDLCDNVTKSEYLAKCHFKTKHPGQIPKYSAIKQEAAINEVKCEICNQVFKDSWRLKSHKERIHDKIKRFECSICQRQFSCRKSVVKHNLAFHEGSEEHTIYLSDHFLNKSTHKPFSCPVCNTGFGDHKSLSNHIKKFHKAQASDLLPILKPPKPEAVRKYQCPGCPRGFDSDKNFRRHLRESHVEKYYEMFPNEGQFKCPACNKGYKILKSIIQHVDKHHPHLKKYTDILETVYDEQKDNVECTNCAQMCSNVIDFLLHLKQCLGLGNSEQEVYVTDDHLDVVLDGDAVYEQRDEGIVDNTFEEPETEEMEMTGEDYDNDMMDENDISSNPFETSDMGYYHYNSNNEIANSDVKIEPTEDTVKVELESNYY